MKTFRAADGHRVAKRTPTAEEIRERRLYWIGVHVATVGLFIVCCFAAGVII